MKREWEREWQRNQISIAFRRAFTRPLCMPLMHIYAYVYIYLMERTNWHVCTHACCVRQREKKTFSDGTTLHCQTHNDVTIGEKELFRFYGEPTMCRSSSFTEYGILFSSCFSIFISYPLHTHCYVMLLDSKFKCIGNCISVYKCMSMPYQRMGHSPAGRGWRTVLMHAYNKKIVIILFICTFYSIYNII